MKKRFILKIIFDIILLTACIWFIVEAQRFYKYVIDSIQLYQNTNNERVLESIAISTTSAILATGCALFALMFFILYNFKDISYLCGSLFKEMKEHKEATKEERKQKKIEELEKQLNELKKDE